MKKELFFEYANIKNQIKGLTEQAKGIEDQVFQEMKKEEVEQVKSDFGTFSITKRKTWKYSDAVKVIEDSLDVQKELEQKSGVATFEEKQSLMFRGVKNETATNN